MPSPRLPWLFVCLLVVTALVGCGEDSGSSDSGPEAEVMSRPAPPKSAFPSAAGKTLLEVVKEGESAPFVVSQAALAFYKGENRFPFGVFEPDRSPVADAEIALYISKVPRTEPGIGPGKEAKGAEARAQKEALEAPAQGPFPAAIESLHTDPAFRAQTTSDDPDAAPVAYTTTLNFPSEGEWRIAALIREEGELLGTLLPSIVVGEAEGVPRPGDKAPLIHTPTAEDVGGDLSEITTRVPPDTQNQVDFADVLGRKPVVLLFATPQFCQSRVCGPVVDVAEQVKEEHGEEAEFIHMEIFRDNDPSKSVRPQVRAYRLPSEPWFFVIDRQGIVHTATEGPFGVERLTEAVEEVTG